MTRKPSALSAGASSPCAVAKWLASSGAGLAVDRIVRADREDLLDRALADQHVRAVVALSSTTDIRRRSKSNGISSILR